MVINQKHLNFNLSSRLQIYLDEKFAISNQSFLSPEVFH